MKNISFLVGLFILPAVIFSQGFIDLNGKVFDGENQLPMKDSHIYILGTDIGTISGENGEFSLNIPWKYADKSLTVSYVGYSNFEQKLSELQRHGIKIFMKPDVIALDEVIVTPENLFLVNQAIEEVMTEYEDRQMMLVDFYNRLFKLDKDFNVLKNLIGDDQLNQ